MEPNQIVNETKTKLDAALEHFEDELKKVRTGRASAGMLDGVMVEAYGTPMPLNQVASIAVPEPQLLQITPFDPNNLQAISSAIRDNPSLGLNPADDGRVVRVPIPPLNEERRREMAKSLNEKLENCLISMRQARHDAMKHSDKAKKDKLISENDQQRVDRQVDELMSAKKDEAEKLAKAKEQEIMTL